MDRRFLIVGDGIFSKVVARGERVGRLGCCCEGKRRWWLGLANEGGGNPKCSKALFWHFYRKTPRNSKIFAKTLTTHVEHRTAIPCMILRKTKHEILRVFLALGFRAIAINLSIRFMNRLCRHYRIFEITFLFCVIWPWICKDLHPLSVHITIANLYILQIQI